MDNFIFNISPLSDTRVAVEITDTNGKVGILYFEKPKIGWVNKPILPTRWACVDAEISGLYESGEIDITPKDIIKHVQDLIASL